MSQLKLLLIELESQSALESFLDWPALDKSGTFATNKRPTELLAGSWLKRNKQQHAKSKTTNGSA